MSFLKEFKDCFNDEIDIYPLVQTTNDIWENIETRPSVSQTGIKCFIILNNKKYDIYTENEVEFVKSTHKVRLEIWPTINLWDKIKDENGIFYNVKYIRKAPWFKGEDDHLVLLVDIII